MCTDQTGLAPEQGQAQPASEGGQANSHAADAAWSQGQSQGQMGSAQAGTPQPETFQTGVPGPEMGQPHFSAQFPGAAPYQGAPLSGQVLGAGAQVQPQGPVSGAPAADPQSMAGQAMYGQAVYGQTMGGNPGYAPGYPVGYAPGYVPGYVPGYAPTYAQAPGGAAAQPGQIPNQYPAQDQTVTAPGTENRYGELYGLIQEAANGNPDVSRFLNFFQSSATDFWKGALVGAGLSLLLASPAVKSALGGGLAGLWGAVSGKSARSAEDLEAEEDRKAEERYAAEHNAEQDAKEATE